MASLRCGQLSGFAAAVLFGCSAPLISTFTASGSSLSIAGLLYAGATLALAIVRLMKGRTQDESPLQRRDAPALAGLILLGGIVGPVALVHGLARLPAASSSLLLNLETVFTLAIAVLVPWAIACWSWIPPGAVPPTTNSQQPSPSGVSGNPNQRLVFARQPMVSA